MLLYYHKVYNMKPVDTQHWRRGEDSAFSAIAGLIVLGAFFSCSIISSAPSLWVGLLLAGGWLIGAVTLNWWYERQRGWVRKVFYVTRTAAEQIVDNVLNGKGLPFEKSSREHPWLINTYSRIYQLDGDGLVLKIVPYQERADKGVSIEIGRFDDTNRPLIQSLQEKIDDAFAPKGL
jgi:hypothetical protein